MHSLGENIDVANVRLTYKRALLQLLEAVAFKDTKKRDALKQIAALKNVDECILIQTCNRIEVFLASRNCETAVEAVKDYLASRAGVLAKEVLDAIEVSFGGDALAHLVKVTSGLESMVIGEDQIINQVWNAYLEAQEAKTSGPMLKIIFNRAVNIGRRVRNETGISRGAVSVGSVTVELAASLLGNLTEKTILVMGAGETGTLVAKSLSRRCLKAIFIANRTYDRAQRLAEELGGRAVKFSKLEETLIDADAVICATSAPHYLLTKPIISQIMTQRSGKKSLLVIDISNPRNVETAIQQVDGVQLYNIDDLQVLVEKNREARQKNTEHALKIIHEELPTLELDVKAQSVRDIISSLFSRMEETRKRELSKALSMLGDLDEKEKKVIDDLTCILLKQTFIPVIEKLRVAATKNDRLLIEVAAKLFEIENN